MSQKQTALLSKQWKITIIIGAAALILIILYFAVFARLLKPDNSASEAPKLLAGEQLSSDNRIYMYEPLNSSNIQKIEVNNEYGGYTFVKEGSDFYIEGHEDAPFDTIKFASLAVSVGNSISIERILPAPDVAQEPDTVDFANYGLEEDSAKASFTVTSLGGISHTVYVGYEISSGQGYYVRVQGRNAVYIVSNDLKSTVLAPVEDLVTPILTYPASSDDYHTIDNFTLWQNGEHFITIHYYANQTEAQQVAATTNYAMTHKQNVTAADVMNANTEKALKGLLGTDVLPYDYSPAAYQYSELLGKMTSFKGTKTVALKEKGSDEIMDVDRLIEYGINPLKPAHELFYTYQGINNYVIFSEKNQDGSYYAYTYVFDMIVEVSGSDADFLEWSFIRWVDAAFFQKNIKNIERIAIDTDTVHADYKLTHEAIENSNNTNLTVYDGGKLLDTANFREFYKVLLTREIRGAYDEEMPGEQTLYLTLKVTTTAGVTLEYKFYEKSSQIMVMTINGDGQFYVLSSSIKKLESDTVKVSNNEKVVSADLN